MRIKNKDEALDILFAETRKEQSPVSQAETISLLQGKNSSGLKRFFNQKTILMIASVFVTISMLLYLLIPAEKGIINTIIKIKKAENERVESFSKNENHVIKNEETKNVNGNVERISNLQKPNIAYKETPKNTSGFTNENSAFPDSTKQTETTEIKEIQSITTPRSKLIELPEEVLNKLNITFSGNGICITILNRLESCYGVDGSTHGSPKDYFIGKPKKQEDGSFRAEVNPKYSSQRDSFSKLEPVLITDDEGKYWRATHFTTAMAKEFSQKYPGIHDRFISDEEREKARIEFMNAELNNFIPILIRLPEKYRKNRQPKKDEWRQDVIMWFQPTEAFLAVLSDTLRTRIMQENPILSNTNLDTKKKPSQLKNIELSIYPNPVIDIATINYHLDKDKKVNIALHDISGKLVKVFVRNETRNAGKNSLEIDLKDLIQGVYILSIETADGNILTQRVIKQ